MRRLGAVALCGQLARRRLGAAGEERGERERREDIVLKFHWHSVSITRARTVAAPRKQRHTTGTQTSGKSRTRRQVPRTIPCRCQRRPRAMRRRLRQRPQAMRRLRQWPQARRRSLQPQAIMSRRSRRRRLRSQAREEEATNRCWHPDLCVLQ